MDYETELYSDATTASDAVERLHSLGYTRDEISVVMEDKTRERAFSAMAHAKGSEGVAAGATVGGVLGAIVAAATATGTIAVTGGAAAPVVIGPLAAALAGLGTGALGGGIVGGLIGLGIGESKAHEYENGLKGGGILLAVKPRDPKHRDELRKALQQRARTTTGDVEMRTDYGGTFETPRTR